MAEVGLAGLSLLAGEAALNCDELPKFSAETSRSLGKSWRSIIWWDDSKHMTDSDKEEFKNMLSSNVTFQFRNLER